jgi:transcriptional regulator with XRE-family HTH domain
VTTFGDTLKELLSERGLPQAELARRMDITPQAVSAWISGGTIPTHGNVTRLEHELDVKPRGFLLGAAGYATDQPDSQPTVESLIRSDPGLDPEDKRTLLRIILLARERHALKTVRPATTADEFQEMERLAVLNQERRAGSPG